MSSGVIKNNIRSSVILTLVSLPLSLGVAHACGVPLFMGVIAALIGALVMAPLSQSNVGVAGPSPNVIVVIFVFMSQGGTVATLGAAVLLAGILQIILGRFKGGGLGEYFPGTVIKGMLVGIGITIIRAQVAPVTAHTGAMVICAASIAAIFLWGRWRQAAAVIPASLFAVVVSVALNYGFEKFFPVLYLDSSFLVNLEFAGGLGNFLDKISLPDWSSFLDPKFYELALVITAIISLESLLALDASDDMDPSEQHTSSKDRELVAQGIGNSLAGLLGGLPIALGIIRTRANVDAGASIKLSSILHGIWIFLCVIFFPSIVELVPIAFLSALLILVGLRLTPIKLYRKVHSLGRFQAIPFYVTIIGVLSVNLMTGVFWGLLVSIFFVMREQIGNSVNLVFRDGAYILNFSKNISFLSKSTLKDVLKTIPENSQVLIDSVIDSTRIDRDIILIFEDFLNSCKSKGIKVKFQQMSLSKDELFGEEVEIQRGGFDFVLKSEKDLDSFVSEITEYAGKNIGNDLSLVGLYLDAKFCLEEVIYNIFSHGYVNVSTDPRVEVVLQRDNAGISAIVTDNASPFNPLTEIPMPDASEEIYLGFNLVRKMAANIDYKKVSKGNQLTLTFN